MSIAAISFDAAGTLIHFARPVGEVYAETGLQYGLRAAPAAVEERLAAAMRAAPLPIPEVEQDAATFEYEWWLSIAAEVYQCRLDDMRLQACFSELFHYYATAAAWRAHDELAWLLQQLLDSDYRLAICSNFDGRLLDVLDALGLSAYFEAVVIPRLAGYVKPQPGIFAAMSQQLRTPPQQILHVGDHAEEDVAAANRMGFSGLRWSLPPEADVRQAYQILSAAAAGK